MNQYEQIERMEAEWKRMTCDVKAEAALVLAIERGLGLDDFMVSSDSLFYREYNKDVRKTEIRQDARNRALLQLHLTRSGFYDHLPEGLFFQSSDQSSGVIHASEMAFQHRLNKQKELDIRRFFLPFENDFFLQRLQLEAEETRLLEGLRSGMLNDYFLNFWNIPRSLPEAFQVPLILLMPYANKICGHLHYTSQCLARLLHEQVLVEKLSSPATETQPFYMQRLGELRLGIETVCGEQFEEDYPVLVFTIGPLQHSHITDYLEGGDRYTLLETFYRFFIPAGVDVQTALLVNPEIREMQIGTTLEPIMGYSSFL